MSTLRITNIEAKADPSSPTVDEKIKLTNSNGDILVHIDGKTSGITTIGINTTAGNIKFDQNSNVVVTGIITATKFVGTIEPTTLTVGGDLTIPDKIVHTGDTNTAIRFPAADTFAIETSGSEKLRINSDGKLILSMTGRTTPHSSQGDGAMFIEQSYDGNLRAITIRNKDTDAAAATSLAFSLNRSGGDYDFVSGEIKSVKEQSWTTTDTTIDSAMVFSTIENNTLTERLRITSDGKVGINQSTPQTTFHSTGTTNGQQATFGIDDSGLKISTFQKTDNDAGVILDAQKSSNGTLTFATAGTERFRITSAGNIGVKVTNPDLTLHVNGVNALPSTSGSTPAGHLTLRAKAQSSSHGMFMGVSNASPWSSWIQAQDANNNATNYPLLLNPNGGNVGVGIDNPGEHLHIVGAVRRDHSTSNIKFYEFSFALPDGATTKIATVSNPQTSSMAIAKFEYTGLYGYGGTGFYSGVEMTSLRRSNNNSAYTYLQNSEIHAGGNNSNYQPNIFWQNGSNNTSDLMITTGTYHIIMGTIRITTHNIDISRVIAV